MTKKLQQHILAHDIANNFEYAFEQFKNIHKNLDDKQGGDMSEIPKPPSHVGTKVEIEDRDGKKVSYTIIDEIIEQENEEKAVYLQKMEFSDKHIEFRIAYWIIGNEEKKMAGKWAFGQFAPMISKEVFERIIEKARDKGWIQ